MRAARPTPNKNKFIEISELLYNTMCLKSTYSVVWPPSVNRPTALDEQGSLNDGYGHQGAGFCALNSIDVAGYENAEWEEGGCPRAARFPPNETPANRLWLNAGRTPSGQRAER